MTSLLAARRCQYQRLSEVDFHISYFIQEVLAMVDGHKTFVCRYYHDGKWWALNITAKDVSDAQQRVARLGNLQLLGELHASIPARVPAAGVIVKLWTGFMNLWRS